MEFLKFFVFLFLGLESKKENAELAEMFRNMLHHYLDFRVSNNICFYLEKRRFLFPSFISRKKKKRNKKGENFK